MKKSYEKAAEEYVNRLHPSEKYPIQHECRTEDFVAGVQWCLAQLRGTTLEERFDVIVEDGNYDTKVVEVSGDLAANWLERDIE